MIDFLSNPYIDRRSFWIGFLAGGLFWWFWGRLRPALPVAWQALKGRVEAAREGLKAGTEPRYRRDVYRYAQKQHLAVPLFSLDEVAIQPHLLPSPPLADPGKEYTPVDVFASTLPFLPDWPELYAAFNLPRLTLGQMLEGGANLILVGNPGSGKTFTLAHLASQVARKDAQAGSLAGFIPIFIHAADLSLDPAIPTSGLGPLIEAASANASPLSLPRLPALLHTACEQGRALLLLDGMDELGPEKVQQTVRYLGDLLKDFPALRVVVAAAPEYFDRLTALGFYPVAMAGWNENDYSVFLKKWGGLWNRFIDQGKTGTDGFEPQFLDGWLSGYQTVFSPLEITLKTWAAFAGDALGPKATTAIEAYLRRMTVGISKARPVLEHTAVQSVRSLSGLVYVKQAEKTAQEVETPSTSHMDEVDPEVDLQVEAASEPASGDDGEDQPPQKTGPERIGQRAINELISSGLLIVCRNGSLRFAHPVLAGYLAGASLAGSAELSGIAGQPHWPGRSLTLQFAAGCSDLSEHCLPWLEQKDDPLYRDLLTAARCLREAPKQAHWRTAALRRFASLLQQDMLSQSVRARLVAAMALSGDPGVAVLFRQLLAAQQGSVRKLAALGCGIIRDPKAQTDLLNLLDDADIEVNKAALLAASAYRTKASLDAMASVLLSGSEEMRRAAAEIFAMDPAEGYSVLKDGSAVEDLLVRRAVVYGLSRVGEPWAIQLLEKIQIEDGEWVVRSAATEALELVRQPHPSIPHPLPPLMNLPWLIAFAGKHGAGIPDEPEALEMLHMAAKSGDHEERMAAVGVLGLRGGETSAAAIYPALYGKDGPLQEASFNAILLLGATGIQLPSPTQIGVG